MLKELCSRFYQQRQTSHEFGKDRSAESCSDIQQARAAFINKHMAAATVIPAALCYTANTSMQSTPAFGALCEYIIPTFAEGIWWHRKTDGVHCNDTPACYPNLPEGQPAPVVRTLAQAMANRREVWQETRQAIEQKREQRIAEESAAAMEAANKAEQEAAEACRVLEAAGG